MTLNDGQYEWNGFIFNCVSHYDITKWCNLYYLIFVVLLMCLFSEEKQTSTEFNINLLTDQIAAANNTQTEIKKLASKFAALETKSSSRDQQQMKVATNVNQLDKSLKRLIERLKQLEASTAKNRMSKTSAAKNSVAKNSVAKTPQIDTSLSAN